MFHQLHNQNFVTTQKIIHIQMDSTAQLLFTKTLRIKEIEKKKFT